MRTTRLLANLPIKRKLMGINLLTSCLALVLACSGFVTYELVVFRGTMVSTLSTVAEMVGGNTLAALSFDDPGAATQTLSSLKAHSNIVGGAIYDKDGKVFATYRRAGVQGAFIPPPMAADGHRFGPTSLELFRSIDLGDERIGSVYIQSDLLEMQTRMKRYFFIVVAVVLTALLAAVLLSARLTQVISRPVSHLVQVAATVATGRDYSIRAVKQGEDELGRLIDGFNHMLGQIQTRDADLHRAQEELEQRVSERTHELQVEIAERKRTQETLAEQAIRDVLTGLYNRRHLNQRLDEEIARAARRKEQLAILLCDLDNFKTINDTLGHFGGDEVLKAVAAAIQDVTRKHNSVFRWGGDEIIVLLTDYARDGVLTAADHIRERIREIAQPFRGTKLDLSIGVAIYPEHGQTSDELVRLADRALYIAKKGGDKVHVGDEEYRLSDQSIKVVFQPIIDIRSGHVMAYEALARDPQGQLSILQLFRRYEALGRLGELKQICLRSQLQAAQEHGLERVFINVDFGVISPLECIPKPARMEVVLEISELEALHDIEKHLETTRRWRSAGYQFALDDFGAGFISLPFVAEALPDYIKVDRSTMLQAVHSEKFRAFSTDLLRTMRNYTSKGLVAEGVETEQELEIIKQLGIDFVQGYLFGKPQALPLPTRRAA